MPLPGNLNPRLSKSSHNESLRRAASGLPGRAQCLSSTQAGSHWPGPRLGATGTVRRSRTHGITVTVNGSGESAGPGGPPPPSQAQAARRLDSSSAATRSELVKFWPVSPSACRVVRSARPGRHCSAGRLAAAHWQPGRLSLGTAGPRYLP